MINIIRDDLLLGGTKGCIAEYIILNNDYDTFIYASPVYGGFQISLSIMSVPSPMPVVKISSFSKTGVSIGLKP
jgi:hypothetical protein